MGLKQAPILLDFRTTAYDFLLNLDVIIEITNELNIIKFSVTRIQCKYFVNTELMLTGLQQAHITYILDLNYFTPNCFHSLNSLITFFF